MRHLLPRHEPLLSRHQPHPRATGRDPATSTRRTGGYQPNETRSVNTGEAEQ